MSQAVKPIVSPCINVCRIDPAGELCTGCHRTLREIAAWRTLSERQRAAIMADLPARAAMKAMPNP